jgi:OOP family OmpA-OmpF porin
MKGKRCIVIAAFAAGFAGAPLFAAAQDPGFYVGGSVGAAKAKEVCVNAMGCDSDETSFKGFAGYQFSRNLAAEAGFQYFGMFGRNNQGIATTALDVLAVGSYPVMDKLSVYGRGGFYWGSMKSKPLSEDNVGFTYSVGAEYALSRELGGRLDWQRYNNVGGGSLGFNTDIDVLSVGIVWRPH